MLTNVKALSTKRGPYSVIVKLQSSRMFVSSSIVPGFHFRDPLLLFVSNVTKLFKWPAASIPLYRDVPETSRSWQYDTGRGRPCNCWIIISVLFGRHSAVTIPSWCRAWCCTTANGCIANTVLKRYHYFEIQGVPKKNVVSWKNSHNYPKTHPKCKCWGCFGKFRIFATTWALRFSKLKKKWLRKWNLKFPTPPPKLGRILCSQYTLIDPLSHSLGHYVPWTWHIRPRVQNYLYFTLYYQRVEQVLLSLQVMKMQRDIKGVHIVGSEFCPFLEGGLATSSFIFSVISSSILKISVPIM